MLVQLLAQRGLDTRVIPHFMVTRDRIAQLDLTGITVIALSYLERTGSSAHLRYLIRRLRQRAPAATIIVGLWQEGDAVTSGSHISQAVGPQTVGADQYVASLAAATTAVIEACEARTTLPLTA